MRTAFPLSGHIGGVSVSKRQKVLRSARAGLIAAALLSATGALAQVNLSVLTGDVVDAASKAPVSDVVVTATSPSLQGEQVVVTDNTGVYRLPQLPPGVYTLRFEKESYRPFSRTGIDVASDRTLRLNVELLPETAGATEISVVGSPPTVDVGSSTVGANISTQFINNIPVSRSGGLGGANRSFDSLALAAPQTAADTYGVGISGGTSPENQYLVDGIAVNNTAFGTNSTLLTSEFVDEVNVITGGYMPEYGRATGGTISAVTKSGGNEFHGNVFGTWTPGALTGTPGVIPTATRTITSSATPVTFGDFGATLGGYLIKDRIWFFVGAQYSAERYSFSRDFSYQSAPGVFTPITNGQTRRFADQHAWNYMAKLTFLLNSDNRINVSVIGTPAYGGGGSSYPVRTDQSNRGITNPAALANETFNAGNTATKSGSLDVIGEWNSSFADKKLLLDVLFGWHQQANDVTPGDGSDVNNVDTLSVLSGQPRVRSSTANTSILNWDSSLPSAVATQCAQIIPGLAAAGTVTCPVSRFSYGGMGYMDTVNNQSWQGKATLTYLLSAAGHHVLKAGFDGAWNQYSVTQAYSGGAWYLSTASGTTVFENRRYGLQSDVDTIVDEPVVTRVVKSQIIGFFVQDSWSIMDKVTLNIGLRYDTLELKNNLGQVGIALSDQWSPRIGLVWDPTQQGRSKIYAQYGRYYENIPLDAANRALSAESQISATHTPCRPTQVGRQACDAVSVPQFGSPLGSNGVVSPSQTWGSTGTPYPSAVDPNLKSPSNDEIVVGGEYEVIPNGRLGVNYTYRNLVNWVEDMSLTNGQNYFIGNPGSGIATPFPKAQRTYNAVTVNFTKSFADLWLAQASYTWSKLEGNLDGLFRPQDGQLDPNINSTFDLIALLTNQYGPLSGDITNNIKLFLAREFPVIPVFSITVGAAFNANSGPPINALGGFGGGGFPLYGDSQAFIVTRGSAGRLPWVTSFDARINFNYRISKDSVFTAGIEGFNLFNSQRPIQVDERYGLYPNSNTGVIAGAAQGSLPAPYGAVCQAPTTPGTPANPNPGTGTAFVGACVANPLKAPNGSLPKPFYYAGTSTPVNVILPNIQRQPTVLQSNITWGQPQAYQGVRQFRFSVRLTF